MEKLIPGLHHFQTEIFRSKQELYSRLAEAQSPEVLFITCSDSRVLPNELTGAGPGELFIVRNAGNIVPPHGTANNGEAATIEYAVAALGVRHIIVCGHTRCGAMQGLLEPDKLARLPAMREWLRHAEATQRIIEENYRHLSGPPLLDAAVEENVLVQMEHLRTLPTVAAALARRQLNLYAWVYQLEDGSVHAYDPDQGQFAPVVAVDGDSARARGRFGLQQVF
ncbi:carbonic anhydrase [Myxococcus sp. K15C18031901]|uniref:carbonic anhydrase n=1 Tax=Myxococcus dinghuensis TaxID=2906761 RepID=UPI0020A78D34|nr:carbonic anhydrase [Myxococcus dinghuensis]MCP3103396.1 carbonic anhydrase [Myxococcus dinghuensis]